MNPHKILNLFKLLFKAGHCWCPQCHREQSSTSQGQCKNAEFRNKKFIGQQFTKKSALHLGKELSKYTKLQDRLHAERCSNYFSQHILEQSASLHLQTSIRTDSLGISKNNPPTTNKQDTTTHTL